MSYTQRLTTSLGPGQAYIHSAQDPGTLPRFADMGEGMLACKNACRHWNWLQKFKETLRFCGVFGGDAVEDVASEEMNKGWCLDSILDLLKITEADFTVK